MLQFTDSSGNVWQYTGANLSQLTTIGSSNNITLPANDGLGQNFTGYGNTFYNGVGAIASVTALIISDNYTGASGGFTGCTALTSLMIGNGITSISASAGTGLANLASVIIGTGCTTIGAYAFQNCPNLLSVVFLDVTAPVTVEATWISGTTNVNIRGHAFSSSNFPAQGQVWNTLTMGTPNPGRMKIYTGESWQYINTIGQTPITVADYLYNYSTLYGGF